mmetsp:Transcript_28324/g.51277  ORF Transcript_28324/g.51277 Transcript_28324/m.51277 type:complete len:102 (-) Transcript_28324:6-311(-)
MRLLGECFQALDEETVGCVHIQVLLTKGAEAITTHTKLSKQQAQDLVDVYVASHKFSSWPTRSIYLGTVYFETNYADRSKQMLLLRVIATRSPANIILYIL